MFRFCWVLSCVILLSVTVFALWSSRSSSCVRFVTFVLVCALARRFVCAPCLAPHLSTGYGVRCLWRFLKVVVVLDLGSCLGSWSRFSVAVGLPRDKSFVIHCAKYVACTAVRALCYAFGLFASTLHPLRFLFDFRTCRLHTHSAFVCFICLSAFARCICVSCLRFAFARLFLR